MRRILSFVFLFVFIQSGIGDPTKPSGFNTPQFETARQEASFACGVNPDIQALIELSNQERWIDWIEKLSGAEPVVVGGQDTVIRTRRSHELFNDGSAAFDYVQQTILRWYPAAQIETDQYSYITGQPWENLILTIPGNGSTQEVVVLSAHLDSISSFIDPVNGNIAPGADDNASGAAVLLEAARIFRSQEFQRTVRLIWFTGEEQGLRGSAAYTSDHSTEDIVGVINLDMFAYDGDNDRCFELHAGTLPQSNAVAGCFTEAIAAYNLDLSYDYLTTGATTRSDHSSFWKVGVGAVEVGENFSANNLTCSGVDMSPYYHRHTDTVDTINASTGFTITRAALYATAAMAELVDFVPPPAPFLLFAPSVSR